MRVHWRRPGGSPVPGADRLNRVVSEAAHVTPQGGVLHDPQVSGPWPHELFTKSYWADAGRVLQAAVGGRGAVVFLRADDEEWALRHYHRGGLPGRLIDDRFVWQGADRTRSFREWRLLQRLYNDGLPVPRPVAAAFQRRGASYTADLLTVRIPGAEPLAAHVAHAPLPADVWRELGRCVRRFHDAGVCHADLNVHNLLLDEARHPWLLDFDRGRVRPQGGWRRDNLDRFLRSLRKLRTEQSGVHVQPADWQALLDGYGQTSA